MKTAPLGRGQGGAGELHKAECRLSPPVGRCYIFVRIRVGHEAHEWQNATQLRLEKRQRSTIDPFGTHAVETTKEGVTHEHAYHGVEEPPTPPPDKSLLGRAVSDRVWFL